MKKFKTTQRQRARRNLNARELRDIESKLHPCPLFNGAEIIHEHRSRRIVFTAWIGDIRVDKGREVSISRDDVLSCSANFYDYYKHELLWLVEGDKSEKKIR